MQWEKGKECVGKNKMLRSYKTTTTTKKKWDAHFKSKLGIFYSIEWFDYLCTEKKERIALERIKCLGPVKLQPLPKKKKRKWDAHFRNPKARVDLDQIELVCSIEDLDYVLT